MYITMTRSVLRSSSCRILTRLGLRALRPKQSRLFSSPPSAFGLSLEFKDDLAILTMDNKDNRMCPDFVKEFSTLLDTAESNTNCRALITSGTGKFFSNGINLNWCGQRPVEDSLWLLKATDKLFYRILLFPVPTMAVLNGHTYAGGALLSFCHDVRVMNSDKGWIRLPEVAMGVPYTPLMLNFLSAKVGGISLSDVALLARKYTADEALHHRLIHAVYPSDSLMEKSVKFLNDIIPERLSRPATVTIKRDIYKTAVDVMEGSEGVKGAKEIERIAHELQRVGKSLSS